MAAPPTALAPSVAALLASGKAYADGTYIQTLDGHLYVADAADGYVTTAGASLRIADAVIRPEHFGADPSGVADSADAFNAAMQACVATGKPGASSGTYKMLSTLAPGGKYKWDWGNTTLAFTGASNDDLVEALHNPDGTSAAEGSGKYILFDTKLCIESVNLGALTILDASLANMRLASRATIPANRIAITASNNNSADMTWGTLVIRGCAYGFWQGDQRGTGTNILPYTRWLIGYLKMQYCLVPLESGQSGNGFDDMNIQEIRMTRNVGVSTIRTTDFAGGTAFLNGLAPSTAQDYETETIAVTASSTSATLSADNANIVVGTVLVIEDAGLNKAGGLTYFVAKVAAKTGTSITLDRAPEATNATAHIACDPPSVLLLTSSWLFAKTYLEELHGTAAIYARTKSGVYGQIKVSNGDLSGRYDCGVLLVDESVADISLHQKSVNNGQCKSAIGVASMREATAYNSNSVRVTVPALAANSVTNSDPVRIVTLGSDDYPFGYSSEASAEANPNLSIRMDYVDKSIYLCRYAPVAPAYAIGNSGGLELGTPALITAATASGNFSSPAGGSSDKTTGGTGYLQHAGIVAGKRYRIAVNISASTSCAVQVRWYASGSLIGSGVIVARTTGRFIFFGEAPATANQMRFFAGATEVFTVNELTIAEVISK